MLGFAELPDVVPAPIELAPCCATARVRKPAAVKPIKLRYNIFVMVTPSHDVVQLGESSGTKEALQSGIGFISGGEGSVFAQAVAAKFDGWFEPGRGQPHVVEPHRSRPERLG